MAEESGVELVQKLKFESFPPLLWGDKTAVLQVIANSLILSSMIEKESLTITVEYISYEGLQITLQGSDDDFSKQFIDSLNVGLVNDKYSTVVTVMIELFNHLDAKYIVSFIDSKSVVATIPMSISEEETC